MTRANPDTMSPVRRLFAQYSTLAFTALLFTSCGDEHAVSSTSGIDVEAPEVASETSAETDDAPRSFTALTWSEQGKLLASDRAQGDNLGNAVALSSDGNTAIVGAWARSEGSTLYSGVAYIYTRSGTTWSQQQKLIPGDPVNGGYFGGAVALSADGNTALVGADGRPDGGVYGAGAVYVFTRSGSSWSQQQRIVASDKAANDAFGWSLALSSDGNTALIGADGNSDGGTLGSGAVYVFGRSGMNYVEQQKLFAGDKAADDAFGWSLALSSDGNTALIGAHSKTEGTLVRSGAAYVFTRSGMTFSQLQKLTASDKDGGDGFGESVALSSDGATAIVGAIYEDDGATVNNGAAYVFARSGTTYSQLQKLSASDKGSHDWFGAAVALSGDGTSALIGASYDDDGFTNNGAVYVFSRSGTSYSQAQRLLANDKNDEDRYGTALAVARGTGTAIVGAPYNFSALGQEGAAYVVTVPSVSPNGAACTAASQCMSGNCIDGVCCNTTCGGGVASDCQACSKAAGASSDGTCAAVKSGTICRAAAGPCDLDEKCSGTSTACPTDRMRNNGTICRSASGPCDIEERCNGTTATCPSNQYRPNTTVCRAAAGPCDLAEFCSGTRPSCPTDLYKPLLVICRPSVGICDLDDFCTGGSPSCSPNDFQPAGTVCRPAASSCDVSESCSGAEAVCPADKRAPDGTSCPGGMCSAGMCI